MTERRFVQKLQHEKNYKNSFMGGPRLCFEPYLSVPEQMPAIFSTSQTSSGRSDTEMAFHQNSFKLALSM